MKLSAGILSFFIGLLFSGFTQTCPQVDVSPDISICNGAYMQISAYHQNYTDYVWSPAAGLSVSTIANPLASPLVTTTYTVTATGYGSNLVVNGDFSLGNTGFISGHNYSGTYSPCNYFVGTSFFDYIDPNYFDHTSTSDNMYMAIDGCNTQTVIWEETFIVDPNTDYTFSYWVTRASVAQPILEATLDGDGSAPSAVSVQVGHPYTGTWTWDEFGIPLWNSGNNTSVTIRIKNLATALGGVDFGLDDVSFKRICTSTNSLTVTVEPEAILDLGPDIGLCSSSSVDLDAGTDFTDYHWSDGSTGQYLNVTQTGTYWLTATSACSGAIQTDSVTVYMSPPLLLDLGDDTTICPGDIAHFNPGSFSSYQWVGSGLSCSDCADPAAVPPLSGVYELTVTNAQGCSATDNIWITVLPLEELDMGNAVSVCLGDSVQLSGPNGFSNYQWTGNNLSCSDCQFPVVVPDVSNTYLLNVVSAQGCSATGNIQVNVFSFPGIELGDDITICKVSETHFPYMSPSSGTYLWTPGIGLSCNDCANPVVSPLDSMKYFLTLTSAQGCTVTDSINVFVKDDAPTQVLAIITDATCAEGGTVVVEAIGNGIDVLQYNLGFQGFSANPLYQQVTAGNYLLSVRNGENGCPYNSVVVVGGEHNSVFIPNAFTPDGNELNNTWSMYGNCITEISCRIFNRWGEEVARLNDLSQAWDGTSKGQMLPDGLYTYVVEVSYASYQKDRITGFVTLLR